MRLWSLHPKYLDAKGLVALWREALLAKNVLQGNTKGYKHHPQLIRFRSSEKPMDAINCYLAAVYEEALKRGYRFDRGKLDKHDTDIVIRVNSGQLAYEFAHLLKKLETRDSARYARSKGTAWPQCHPVFQVVDGGVEEWEKGGGS